MAKDGNAPVVHSKQDEVITLNIQPFLMPMAILLSAVLISSSLLWGFNKVSKNGVSTTPKTDDTTTTDTTTDTTGDTAQPQVTGDSIKALFTDDNLTFGDSDKSLLFVEVSDPSCPYCHIAGGENPELSAQVGDRFKYDTDGGSYVPPVREMRKLVDEGKAAFVWLYTNGHGNGELGAQALYCADEKGKYWEAHDLLMSNAGYELLNNTVKNDTSKAGTLADFLKGAVDSSFMKSCLESGKYAGKLSEDQSTASSLGVNGTPGFFVNTTNFAGAYSFTDMQSVVDAAL